MTRYMVTSLFVNPVHLRDMLPKIGSISNISSE